MPDNSAVLPRQLPAGEMSFDSANKAEMPTVTLRMAGALGGGEEGHAAVFAVQISTLSAERAVRFGRIHGVLAVEEVRVIEVECGVDVSRDVGAPLAWSHFCLDTFTLEKSDDDC